MRLFALFVPFLLGLNITAMDLSHIEIESIPIDETNEEMSRSERDRLCRATFGREYSSGSNVCRGHRRREYGERSFASKAEYWVDFLLGNEPEEETIVYCEMLCSRDNGTGPNELTEDEEAAFIESLRETEQRLIEREVKINRVRNNQNSRRTINTLPPVDGGTRETGGGTKVQIR